MKLINAKIENFKCIEDSGRFSVGKINCYVGKNEAGKSALLQALYRLNPVVSSHGDFDPIIEYPRRKWSEYKERHDTNPDNVLITEWVLDEEDIKYVTDLLGEGILSKNKIIITKGYDNKLYWDISINEKQVLLNQLKQVTLFEEECKILETYNSIEELLKILEVKNSCTENETALFQKLIDTFPQRNASQKVTTMLNSKLPTFLYFADYDMMIGTVSIDDLQQRIKNNNLEMPHRIFKALLDLVGTTPENINKIGRFEELIAELEAVSSRLSEEIFRYWSQNRYLEIEFRFDYGRPEDPLPYNKGYVFRTRIRNTRHKVTVSFDERSAGFVWFFSFLVWFSQVRKTYGENLFILLDDPGLSLHARAQADLLRYINERLVPNYQVIYTTHSPFMIDPENLLSVRTIEDVVTKEGEILGTKVSEDVLTIDPDTLFPLQAALGYDITQTLFIGKNCLLVEGPSDLLYLKWFSRELKVQGREYLDPRWVIIPCGGIGKVSIFMRLFSPSDINVAVFTDYHTSTKGRINELKKSNILRSSHIFSADMFVNNSEADIEDLIGRHCYIMLINQLYALPEDNAIPHIKPRDAPMRVVEEINNHLSELEIDYDHYTPAVYLTENRDELIKLLPKLDDALHIFERLFKELNQLLHT